MTRPPAHTLPRTPSPSSRLAPLLRQAMTISDAARLLGFSPSYTTALWHMGTLPGVRVSRNGPILLERQTVEQLAAERQNEDDDAR